jgi:1-acyl-sn-glycerol-3-phosphate acyltransferase
MPGASFSVRQWVFIVFFRWCFRALFWLSGGLEVQGLEHVPTGAILVAANHKSLADPWLMLAATPRLHRYLAARELHAIPLLGRFMAGMGSSPITRGAADHEALAKVARWLAAGDSVVVFAEGRISGEGFLPLQPGVAVMSLRTQVPILPVAIRGSDKVLGLGARWPRRHKIVVRFGAPIVPPPPRPGRKVKAEVSALLDQVAGRIAELYSESGSGAAFDSHGKG